MNDAQFSLTEGERISPLWTKLKDRFETMLQTRRAKNDNPKLTEAETAALRGEINLLNAIIKLGNPPPILDGNDYPHTASMPRAGTMRPM